MFALVWRRASGTTKFVTVKVGPRLSLRGDSAASQGCHPLSAGREDGQTLTSRASRNSIHVAAGGRANNRLLPQGDGSDRACGPDRSTSHKYPRRLAVDLSLSPEDLAFRDEVRRFLADNVRPGMGRAIDLTTAFIVDPDILIDFHRALAPQGLVGAALAGRAWRHRLVAGATLYLRSRMRPRRRGHLQCVRLAFRRARHHPLRDAGAEGQVSPAHPLGRGLLGARLFRTRARAPTSHP